jgi:hypothetical protein
MIAAHVSYRDDCDFCQLSHSAAAAAHLNGNYDLVEQIKLNPETAVVSDKLKALLVIAGTARNAENESPKKMSRPLGSTERRTKRSIIRCSLPLHFSCTTVTWMDRPRGSRANARRIGRWAGSWHAKAMYGKARVH